MNELDAMIPHTLVEKWEDMLEEPAFNPISNTYKKKATARLLENQEIENTTSGAIIPKGLLMEAGIPVTAMGTSSSTAGAGPIDTFDPILISMVRRTAPNLIAYDLVGVQPMTGPTGLVFAMRSRYANMAGDEAFYDEVNTMFSSVLSGANTFGQKHVGTLPVANGAANGTYNTGTAMSRAQAEALGSTGNAAWPKMSFSIEKFAIEAGTRALESEYTMEIAQDLKAIHGLDARAELINMLSTEINAEINREIIRTINFAAKIGCQTDTTAAGIFDCNTDSSGRWSVEKWKGMMFQLDREANEVAKQTRRGKANFALMTSDVASALQAAGVLDYTPAIAGNNLQVDDTGNTFAGVLNGRTRVYIDPYASGGQYITTGYKGPTPMEAGIFYCPYVPLQLVNAIEPGTYTPKLGFKTRYAIAASPFAEGLTKGAGVIHKDSNVFYRKFLVTNLL